MSVYKEANRVKALSRAAQMMRLFSKNCWADIMKKVDVGNPIRNEFDTACNKVTPPLTTEEKDWLWNYLQHVHGNWGNVQDAASSGW